MGLPHLGEIAEVLGGVIPVQNRRHVVRQVTLQRFFQAIATIRHGDQVAHLRDPQRPRLATHLRCQDIQLEINQVAAVLLLRRIQQCRVQHAVLRLAGTDSLHRHAEGIQPHIRRRLAPFTRCCPLQLRLRWLDHPSFFQLRAETLALGLGTAEHRRGRQPHAREALEHILGGVGKRQQGPSQTHQGQ